MKMISTAFVFLMMVKVTFAQSMILILICIEFIMINLLITAILHGWCSDMSMLILLFLCMMISEGVVGLCILVTTQTSGVNFIFKMNNLSS